MKFLSKSILGILFFVLACTEAAPSPALKRCSITCDESRNLFNYKIGKKYVYDFKSVTLTHIPKGTTEKAQIELSGKAEFHIMGKCDVVLTLNGVSMKEKLLKGGAVAESRDLKALPKLLQNNPLPFGFNDGRVTNLCPSSDEGRISMNVKRAIVSLFQNNMAHLETPMSLTESDVSGVCLTEYRFKGRNGNNIQIEKTKAILGCANRKVSYSDLQGQNFDKTTERSQIPLLKGSQTCNLQVSREPHLLSCECKEIQVFRPFSGKSSGATFEVTQTLSLTSISESTLKMPKITDNTADLLLEHNPDGYRDYRAENEDMTPEDVLKQICADVEKDPLSSAKVIAQTFPKFMRYLRDLDGKGLRALQGKIGTAICKKSKKMATAVFQDAIPMVRTPDAVIFMLDEMAKGKSVDYRRSWLFSLATVREPTIEMINKLDEIGNKLNNPLIASSLVATYCKMNELCYEEKTVKSIVARITNDLGNDCSGDKQKVLLALRAIGNLGMVSNWDVLDRCLRNTEVPVQVRVSAAQAMRKVRCDSPAWEKVGLLAVFQSPTEDNELRINSYLSLITCSARPGVLEAIIKQLDDENCQQVGSFVWSHLSNIHETSQVFRQTLRTSLRRIKFDPSAYAKRFQLDFRKFSKNYEKSYFYEPFNSGLSFESNVIFADSFLPKSMSANVTAELFGKSISLVELGVRGNNVDQMFQAAYQSAKPMVRKKRSDGSSMVHFSIDKFKQQTFGKKIGAPSVELYLRMFGNELAYVPDLGLDYLMSGGVKGQMSRLGKALSDFNFENSRMLMEAMVSVPTLSGFALELSLDLASSVSISALTKLEGKWPKMSVMASYAPSGAVSVQGRMRLDTDSTQIGIEIHSVMFRNFKLGGKVSSTGSEVTLLLDAPQEKATLINLKSNMFLIHKRAQRKQETTAELGQFKLCNTKRSQKVFGLKLCIDANYANNSQVPDGPSFPFTGDNELNVAVIPVAKFSQFKLRGKYIPTDDTMLGVRSLEMEMNAVGSKEDRQLLFAMNDNSKGTKVDMSLKMFSPIKKFEMVAKGDTSSREMDASVKVDNSILVKLTTKHKMEGPRSVTTIVLDAAGKPKIAEATLSSDTSLKMNEMDHIFEFKAPKFYVTYLKATAFKKFLDDLSVSTKYSFAITGSMCSAEAKVSLNLKEESSDGKLDVSVKKGNQVLFGVKNSFSMKTVSDKSVNDGANLVTEHTIKFSNTFDLAQLAFLNVKDGVLVIQHDYSPDLPEANRYFSYNLKADDLQHATTFQLSQTQTPFALILSTYLRSTRMKIEVDNKMNVAVNSWKAVRIDNTFTKDKNKKYELAIENTINPDKVTQEAKLTIPSKIYHIRSNFVNLKDSIFKHTFRIAWAPDKSYDLKSVIDWGMPLELQSCQLFYQLNSTAFKDGQQLANFYINSCPNLQNRALSIEAQMTDRNKKRTGYFRGDVVFKTEPTDFHFGCSAEADIPKIINVQFRTNHIYAEGETKTEVTSHVMTTYKLKEAEDFRTYGYELLGKSSEQKIFEASLSVSYVYPQIGQMKSKYAGKVDIKGRTKDSIDVETTVSMNSMLIGKAEITANTQVTQRADGLFGVKSSHVFSGKVELASVYEFEGNYGINAKFRQGEFLKISEKFKLNVKNLDSSTSTDYKYDYNLKYNTANVRLKSKATENNLKFNWKSNFALQKLDYVGKSVVSIDKGMGVFKYDSTEKMTWTYDAKKGQYDWILQAEATGDSFVGHSKMTSSYDVLKLMKITVKLNQNLNEPSLQIKGAYNNRKADFLINAKYAKKPAVSLTDDPDFMFGIALKGDIPYVEDGKVTLKTYYNDFKFLQFDTTIVHMGPTKSNFYLNGGYSLGDMLAKVELGASTPFGGAPQLKMVMRVVGKTDSNLDPIGLISQRLVLIDVAEASLKFGQNVDVLVLVTQKNTGDKGAIITTQAHMMVGQTFFIPKNTKLVLKFKKNDLSANEGKLYFEKNTNSPFETFEQTFSYNFDTDLFVKTEYRYQARKVLAIGFQWPEALSKQKSMEFYFKPSKKKIGFSVDFKASFLTSSLNFDSSMVLRYPQQEIKLKVSSFQSINGKTKKTALLQKAVKAFSVSLSTSMKQLVEFKFDAALDANRKGMMTLTVVTKKTFNAKMTIDLSDPSKLTGSVELNGAKIDVSLERKGSGTKLIVKANGKQIGEANVKYVRGQSLDVSLDATSPSGMRVQLTVNHEHPQGKWDWKNWKHKSSADVSKKGKLVFKGSQMISFDFNDAKKQSALTANFDSSIEAFNSLKSSCVVGWKDDVSTKLDVLYQGAANSRFSINHNVKNWNEFFKSAQNKVEFKGSSNFLLVFNSESPSGDIPELTFEVGGDFNPYVSLIYFSIDKNSFVKFMSKSIIGNVNFETNGFVPKSTNTREVFIRGEVPKFGKFELVLGFPGPNKYKLLVKIGKHFVTLYPTVMIKSKTLPFDASFSVKIETSFSKILTGNVETVQKVGTDYLSAEHSTKITLMGATYLVVAAGYDVASAVNTANLAIEKEGNKLKIDLSLDTATNVYKHNIVVNRKALGKRPLFESVADCGPYDIRLVDAKCSLSVLYGRTKMVIEAINDMKGSKSTKTLKLAWNDLRKQFVKFIYENDVNAKIDRTTVTWQTPIRSYRIEQTVDAPTDFMTALKLSTLDPGLKTTLGFVNLFIQYKPLSADAFECTVRISSSLLKKEIKTVVNSALGKDDSLTVTANMFIDKPKKPSLSMTFTMTGMPGKRELNLKLVGGDRFLNMLLNYDITNPMKQVMKIGARAKDWKRELTVLFEPGRRLKTEVDTGKTKQTLKLLLDPIQNNGYRNVLIIDYPEVKGFLKVMLQLNRSPLSLLVIVQRDKAKPENQLVINLRHMNSRNILMEIKRIIGLNQKTDAYYQVTLSPSKVIETTLKWRPAVFSDFKNFLLYELAPTKMNEYLRARGKNLVEVLQRVAKAVAAPIKANVKLSETLDVAQAVVNDFTRVKNAIVSGLQNYKFIFNRLRLTKLTQLMQQALQQISTFVQMTFDGLKKTKGILPSIDFKKMSAAIKKQYSGIYKKVKEYTKDWDDKLFIKFLTNAKQFMSMAVKSFIDGLDRATVVTKRWAAKRDKLLASLRQRIGASMAQSKSALANVRAWMKKVRGTVTGAIMKQLFTKEDLKEWSETMQKLRILNNWIKSAFKSSRKASDLQVSMKYLRNGDLNKAFFTYFKPEKNKIIVWKPKQGFVSWQFYFPYDIRSLQTVPAAIFSYMQSRVRSTVKEIRQGSFTLGKYYLRLNELLFRYSPRKALMRQLPPYQGNAWTAGSQHHVTFSGASIEYSGACSYLLAHDFVKHAYSVLGEYTKMGKMIKRKNLIVQTSKVALYISPRGHLRIRMGKSGKPTLQKAPFAAGDLFVSRWGSILTVKGPNQLSIRCFLDFDVCRITVSPWSHGHINGFLGSNDYEKGNDVYRGHVTGVAPFSLHAEAWTTSKGCKSKNYAVTHMTYAPNSAAYRKCRIFTRRSSFSRCFAKVDPASYLKSCMNMHQMAPTKTTSVCRIFLMYVSKCRAEGIILQMPRTCITCGLRKFEALKWRKPFTIKQKYKKNFVFIVEAKPRNKKIVDVFKELVKGILSRKEDDTYNLITFGGSKEFRNPTLHMLSATRTRGKKGELEKAMNNIRWNGNDADNDGQVATKAVQMALGLNDDFNSATVVVLITASKCQETARYQYTNIHRRYSKRGIRFYYFLPHNFGSDGKLKVVGFTPPDAINEKAARIDRKLVPKIIQPKDTCSALARSTGGSTWDIDTLLKMKGAVRSSMLKNALKKQHQNRRVCFCSGSFNNDDVIQCVNRK